jgi:hypothetical protein
MYGGFDPKRAINVLWWWGRDGPSVRFGDGASTVLRTGRRVDTSPPSWELRSARQVLRCLRRLTFAASTNRVNRSMSVVSSDDVGS